MADRNEEAKRLGYISYQLAPGDELQTCPYVDSHRVRKERFSRHLSRCRANYLKDMEKSGKQVDFGICRLNSEHHCPLIELKTHEMMCPNMSVVVDHLGTLQTFKAPSNTSNLQNCGVNESSVNADVGCVVQMSPEMNRQSRDPDDPESAQRNSNNAGDDEDDDDWEEEVQDNLRRGFESYNPQAKLAKFTGRIIQTLPGITTKSERKAFRQQQFQAFERAGGDFFDGSQPRVGRFVAAESNKASDIQEDLRAKRAKDLRLAQRAAALAVDHMSEEHKKRRSDQAEEQIKSVLQLARAEAAGTDRSSVTSSFRSLDITSEISDSFRSTTDTPEYSDTFSEDSVATVKKNYRF